MKKIAIIVVVVSIFMFACFAYAEPYLLRGYIDQISISKDCFWILSYPCNRVSSRQLWQFDQIEDWCLGDICIMLMDDMGTEDYRDDVCIDMMWTGRNIIDYKGDYKNDCN